MVILNSKRLVLIHKNYNSLPVKCSIRELIVSCLLLTPLVNCSNTNSLKRPSNLSFQDTSKKYRLECDNSEEANQNSTSVPLPPFEIFNRSFSNNNNFYTSIRYQSDDIESNHLGSSTALYGSSNNDIEELPVLSTANILPQQRYATGNSQENHMKILISFAKTGVELNSSNDLPMNGISSNQIKSIFDQVETVLGKSELDKLMNDYYLNNSNLLNTTDILPDFINQFEETKVVSTNINECPPDVEFSDGLLCWSRSFVRSKALNNIHHFVGINNSYLQFISDKIINLLLFKYSCNTFSFFCTNDIVQPENLYDATTAKIQAIFSTVFPLDPPLKPFYRIFTNAEKSHNSLQPNRKVPLYFTFTSISYLLRNENSVYENVLKGIVKTAFKRCIKAQLFTSYEWKFLEKYLRKNIGIVDFLPSGARSPMCYDITIVAFIYNRMNDGKSDERFFSKVWRACKSDCTRVHIRTNQKIQLESNFNIFIPISKEYNTGTFKLAARKLYQIEFTKIMLTESLDTLFPKYKKLKSDFDGIEIDFKCRILNRRDFDQLNIILNNLCSSLVEYPVEIGSIAHEFFVELEYFINFKSLAFIYDLANESKHKYWYIMEYKNTFQNIQKILINFDEIRKILITKGVLVEAININRINPATNSNRFSLRLLVDKYLLFFQHNTGKLVAQKNALLNEINLSMNEFDYFQHRTHNLGYVSGFKWAEFVAELEDILNQNNEQLINMVFKDKKYEIQRKSWAFVPGRILLSSIENKKSYLEYFKNYLIFNNQ